MKNCFFIMLSIFMLASCKPNQMTIEVSNPSNIVHENTTVEILWSDVVAKLPAASPANVVVVNAETGSELTRQIVYHGASTPQALIFQVTLAPSESVKLFVKEGVPKEPVYKTFGRFVPERKDDFAWENDRVVYRIFGPGLAAENPSSGLDLWLKKTENLIINKFYKDDLENDKSYHVDWGEGLDCYKVGAGGLGAGALAPFVNGRFWPGKHFITQEVLDNGPIRTSFRVTYDNYLVEEEMFSKSLIISIDAGSQFSKAVVSFDGNFTEIGVAAGIILHDDPGNIKTNLAAGYHAFGEIAVSDAGLSAGRNYVATVIPDGKMTQSLNQQSHLLAIASYRKGEEFTYYFGAGWSEWGFENDQKWFDHVATFAEKLKNPLRVAL